MSTNPGTKVLPVTSMTTVLSGTSTESAAPTATIRLSVTNTTPSSETSSSSPLMPTGYNRDLQEDKEAVFDSVDTLTVVLPAMTGAVAKLEVVRERVASALQAGLCATDLAEHLVRRGVPFRASHHAVGALVRIAEASGRELSDLAVDEMRSAHPAFGDDAAAALAPAASVESRALQGGTATVAVEVQLRALAEALREA